MARSRAYHHRKNSQDRILPPVLSHKILAMAVAGFVAAIVLFVVSANLAGRLQSNSPVSSKNLFHSASEIPAGRLQKIDAILVLGGGRPTALEQPPVYVQRRCDDAADVVRRRKEISKFGKVIPVLCLSAGTAHLPQLMGTNGRPIWESTSSAAYLQKHHGLSSNVYVETTSFDTIGNAFFARTSHTDVAGWRNLLIVTNKFHMERTKAIFEWVFGLDRPRPAYVLTFLESPDVGLQDDALQARSAKEAKSLAAVHGFAKQYRTMLQLWSFLNQQHDLYSASQLVQGGGASHLDAESAELVKKSYGGGGTIK